MPEGRWADWQVREIAESFGDKRPKREWFDSDDRYYTSLKSWAHLCAHQLHTLILEERQLVIFLYQP